MKLKIGHVAPLTGGIAHLGKDNENGARLAIDQANEAKIKIGGKAAQQVVVEGTFKYNPAPFNPRSKSVLRPDYKMIAIHFEGPKEIYHIKLTGPAKTVDHYAKGFETWIKGMK